MSDGDDPKGKVIPFPRPFKGVPAHLVAQTQAHGLASNALILGQDANGNFVFFCDPNTTNERLNWLLDRAKQILLTHRSPK